VGSPAWSCRPAGRCSSEPRTRSSASSPVSGPVSDVVATELDPCVGPIVFVCDLVSNATGSAQAAASDYVLGGIASAFTNAAAHLGEMALRLLDSSTAVDLSADWLRANVGVVAAVTLPLVVGLFAAQVIGSVLRREGAGLARAVVGVGKALLGGALALGATQLALTAVDEMCEAVAGADRVFCESEHDDSYIIV